MNPLSPEFNQFFVSLAAHNHKDWFDEHRKQYHAVVKEPFEQFVTELIKSIQAHDTKMQVDAKDCIFRINRDIRFSKDKTPYKLNRSAAINYGGRKDFAPSGVYVELGPEHIRLYRGLFQVEKADVEKIRAYWSKNIALFKEAYSERDFVKNFGSIRGETNVRLPKELQDAAEKESLIFNKSWYYFVELPASEVTNPKLIEKLTDFYLSANPMCNLLAKALG